MLIKSYLPANRLIVLLAFLCLPGFATATRIYKSTDEHGNVTYSSHPPKEAVSIEKISVPANYDVNENAAAIDNINAIKQTADQFEAERLQRERERKAEQKELEEQERKQAEQAKPPEKEIRYVPVYPPYNYPGHHHPRPQPRPKPHHPRTPSPLPQQTP